MTDRRPLVLMPGEHAAGLERTFRVGGMETKGGFSLRISEPVPPGRWIDDHIHHREDEAWFVLDGTLSFRLEGRVQDAPQGTFILVPRGVTHGFGNLGDEPARFLELFCPAGMEGYFEERGELALTEPGQDFAGLSPARHEELASKYHMEFVRLPRPER